MRKSFAKLPQWRSGFAQTRRRLTSQKAPANPPTPNEALSTSTPSTGFQRILARTPKFLRPHVSALRNAPVSHITAFLLLHELTAVIPLFGLAGTFHYLNWLPPYFAEGAWVVAGVEKFGRWFKKRGWISASAEDEAEREAKEGREMSKIKDSKGLKWWNRGEGGVRWVVEFATAYAVVKALMPLRLIVSAWGAPWFARWTVIPVGNGLKSLLGRGKRTSPTPNTNAVVAKKP